MRTLLALLLLLPLSIVAAAADAECKVSTDCVLLGPECCGGECRAIPKKDFKRAKKELDTRCKVAECAAPSKGPTVSCGAQVVCMQGKCELGHTKAWDADKKKDDKKGGKPDDQQD